MSREDAIAAARTRMAAKAGVSMAASKEVVRAAPTDEQGVPGSVLTPLSGFAGRPDWAYFVDDREFAPELQWPRSVEVNERMETTDAQVKGLLLATFLPIRRMRWELDPAEARPEAVALAHEDLNLPVRGDEESVSRRGGFNHDKHLGHSLRAVGQGHYHFEEVLELREDGLLHLQKLGTRPPRSIIGIRTDDHGNLEAIEQMTSGLGLGGGRVFGGVVGGIRTLKADRLLTYLWDTADDGDQVGRALDPATPVPTPDGWRTINDLEEGDKVFDEEGRIAYVTGTAEWEDRPCFEVEFGDGTTIVADERHEWLTHTARERYTARGGQIRSTAEVAETQAYAARGTSNHAVQLAEPLDYPEQALSIHPWVLGLWLGDGTARTGDITCHVDDAEETATMIRAAGYPAKVGPNGKRGGLGRKISTGGQGFEGLAAHLRLAGLKGNKHIPTAYLRGSVAQRFALLQGLMDSDGYVNPSGLCVFDNTNENLTTGVAELVRSLGIKAKAGVRAPAVEHKRKLPLHSVYFSPPPGLVPFRLARKVARADKLARARRWHYITAVKPVAKRRTKCIEVSSLSHLFLAGEAMVPTHNSVLRACYRNFLVKDALIRVDAVKHERNAMGIPWFEVDPAASKDQIESLARRAEEIRASTVGGGAGPGKLRIAGVEGSLPDTIGSIRYHDEQMAKALMQMLFNLGGDANSGARALGDTFAERAIELQGAIADWYCEATQAFIDRQVERNFGPGEASPQIAYTRTETYEVAFADLATGVKEGLIAVTPELRAYVEERWKVPGQKDAPEPSGTPVPAPEDTGEGEPAGTLPEAAEGRTRPQPKRSALAEKMAAALTAPMTWPQLARAVGTDSKNGTARRARDQLLAEGAVLRGTDGTLQPAIALELPDRDLKRAPLAFEVAAQVNFAAMEEAFEQGRTTLVDAYRAAQTQQIAQLVAAVEAAHGDAAKLATLECDPVDVDVLAEPMMTIAEEGVASARTEHEAQMAASMAERAPARKSLQMAEADTDALRRQVDERAEAASLTLAAGLATSASKKAAAVSTLAPEAAAAAVSEHLNSLTDAALDEQLGGATQQAYNSGRRAYFRESRPKEIYASEILDQNVCAACNGIDGTEWATLAEAETAYPVGGYLDCEGGLRCRGTLVAVY